MNIEQYRSYCIAKKAVTESFPFDEKTLVFKVMNKMFALSGLDNWEKGEPRINLKCNPDKSLELRGEYESINPGWHMNKTHWNSVVADGTVSLKLFKELVDHSYDLIVKSLPKKTQEDWSKL